MALTNGTATHPALVPLWINGKAAEITPATTIIPIVSAATSKTVHHAVSASREEAIAAADAAEAAFSSWSRTSPTHRRKILLKVAEIYESRLDEIAGYQVSETSCPEYFAKWNTNVALKYIREIASATTEIRGIVAQRDTEEDGSGLEVDGLTIVIQEAVGVVLIIPPWNGAVILPTRAMCMALAAGCTIVVKSSEKCPRTHRALVEAFEEAGVPVGVINQVLVRREDAAEVTEALIAHKSVRKVDFIGSASVGKVIGQLATKYLKPVLMELGGKGPAVVLDDADLERAAKLCATGATLHHGQLCFSTERIIVQKAVADKFTDLLKNAFAAIPSAGTAVDKVSSTHAYEVLADAERQGAMFLVGKPEFLSDMSVKPALLTNIPATSRIRDEETFGPSASVYVVESDEEAIKVANDTSYGLSAAVHSSNWERALKVARRLDSGQVQINQMTVADAPTQPIRGVKGSGWGQSNSIWGIREFLVEKTINFAASANDKDFVH